MSFDLNEISVNKKLATEGVWTDFFGDSRLKVASIDSPKYQGYLARLARENKIKLDDKNPALTDLINDMTAEAMSKHLLLDWEGIKINGEEVEYSHEIGKKALLKSRALREFVDETAKSYEMFQKGVAEDVKEP